MREKRILSDHWQFIYGLSDVSEINSNTDWKDISVPHTWNNLDGQDGGGNYLRGKGWYKYSLDVEKDSSKEYWLEFLGVNSVADLYVNGMHIGQHRGGYTLFRFNVTDAFVNGNNQILVCADNSPFADVIPLTADFTFFGGIYRDVHLIVCEKTHFALDDYGSDGVNVTYHNSPEIIDKAVLNVSARINGVTDNCSVTAEVTVPDTFEKCDDISVTDFNTDYVISYDKKVIDKAKGNIVNGRFDSALTIHHPHLWNGRKDPFLYKVVFTLYNGDTEIEKIEKYIGIRCFSIDSRKGFFLNGASYPLRGVNRHQDRKDMGWAITAKEHDEDFAMIYEIGANAIRLAHYPHHPHFYDLCDRYGLLVWAEIPFVDRIGGLGISGLPTDTVKDKAVEKSFLNNAKLQMTELIKQQGHRPSIFCWSMSNEVMAEYGKTAQYMMEELDKLVHSLDNQRYSALATNHTKSYKWKADIRGCNIYPGWYGGKETHFPLQANYHIRANRLKGVAVSEYGAGSNVLHHSEKPSQPKDTVCDFHSEEWQSIVHENALKYFMKKRSNKIWGTFVWNMFDFAIDSRNEGAMPGMNNKGLVTYDRKIKKDAFYLYKSYWSSVPVVHITSSRFSEREERTIDVKVYSNASEVTLRLNGKKITTIKDGDNKQRHIFVFKSVQLENGDNAVTASAGNLSDTVNWKYNQ